MTGTIIIHSGVREARPALVAVFPVWGPPPLAVRPMGARPSGRVGGSLPRYFGPYALFEALGRGASATAYLGRPIDPNTAKRVPDPVVVKVLHEHHAENDSARGRFQHECEMAVMLDSPHIARVFDVGRVGSDWYLAMDFIRGWRLSEYLRTIARQKERPALADTLAMFAGLLAGLHALHQARHSKTSNPLDAVHRDVSPSNVMLAKDAHACLIDLGLGNSALKEWRTRTGTLMGTPGYMSPEAVKAEAVDHRSDLYGAAIVCYELATVTRYIKGKRLSEVLRASAQPTFEAPSVRVPSLPRGLDDVLKKALSIRPQDRFQSATEFAEALKTVVPESPSQERLESFLKNLLPPPNDADIDQILGQSLPEDEPEDLATELWVQRELPPPDVAAAGLLSPVQSFSSTGSAEQSEPSVPLVIPVSKIKPRTSPGTIGRWVGATAAVITATAAVTWAVSNRSPTELQHPPNVDTPAVQPGVSRRIAPGATNTAVAPRAQATAVAAPPATVSPPPKPTKVPRVVSSPVAPPKTKVRKPKRRTSPETAPPPTESAESRLEKYGKRLLKRGGALKLKYPDRAADVDTLLTDVSMELAANDAEQALLRLKRIEKRLQAISAP